MISFRMNTICYKVIGDDIFRCGCKFDLLRSCSCAQLPFGRSKIFGVVILLLVFIPIVILIFILIVFIFIFIRLIANI